jgi:hypothetical protein
MATSSITGGDRAPSQATGRDVEALGPSDTSDSGSDVQGELDLAPPIDLDNPSGGSVQPGLQSDSDAAGTGERGAALLDEEARAGGDILPDLITDLAGESSDEGLTEAELNQAELADIDELPLDLSDEEDDNDEEGRGGRSR